MDADGDGPVGRTLAAVATSGGQSLGAADGTDSALRTRPLNLAVATSVAGSVLVFVAIALGALWAFQAAAVAQAKNEAGLFGEVAARVALARVRAQRERCVNAASRRARLALEHGIGSGDAVEAEWLNYTAILVQVDRIVGDLSAPLPA